MHFPDDPRDAPTVEASIADYRRIFGEVRESLIDEIMVSAAERVDPARESLSGDDGEALAASSIHLSLIDKAMVEIAPVGDLLVLGCGCGEIAAMLGERVGGQTLAIERWGSASDSETDTAPPWPKPADCVLALDPFRRNVDPIATLCCLHEATARVLVIETMLHDVPVPVWLQAVSRASGSKVIELQPTYRGMINSLHRLGFASVAEIVPAPSLLSTVPYATPYHTHRRGLFVAQKTEP